MCVSMQRIRMITGVDGREFLRYLVFEPILLCAEGFLPLSRPDQGVADDMELNSLNVAVGGQRGGKRIEEHVQFGVLHSQSESREAARQDGEQLSHQLAKRLETT